MTTSRLHVGDVFLVPLTDALVGVGQAVGAWRHPGYFYLALFGDGYPPDDLPPLIDITRTPIVFLALSMDAKVAAGHWTIVGQAPVPPDVPLPAYKEAVGTPSRIDVVDYSGMRRRPARDDEAAALPNRTVIAPRYG